jgi:hypothetical protein
MTDRHKQRDEAIKNDLMKEQDQRMPINVDRQSRVPSVVPRNNFFVISRSSELKTNKLL